MRRAGQSGSGAGFKACPMCDFEWPERSVLLGDSRVELVGYQADFQQLREGLFLFNHFPCETTFSLQAGDFCDLYDGPIFSERITGSKDCPGFCLNRMKMGLCPQKCECAYVREVLEIVRNWPKTAKGPAQS